MNIPHDTRLESSLALLREGYEFIGNGCQRLRSPIFEARILFQRTYCLQGHEAAAMFYQAPQLSRVNAAPRLLSRTLLGEGALQGMDGAAHRGRKRLFLDLLTGAHAERLIDAIEAQALGAMRRWPNQAQVDVLKQWQTILFSAVCRWAGLPPQSITPAHQRQLVALFEDAGGGLFRHVRSRHARKQAERWAAALIETHRRGDRCLPADSPAARVADYRDLDAGVLPARIAAVELLNLLRPVIAISYFLLYAMVELARHPAWQEALRQDDRRLTAFIQEVRRLYAFFPFVAARVSESFSWQGRELQRGARVLLDLYGSNRAGDCWVQAEEFRPERFEGLSLDNFTLISQGGGDAHDGHRCAGEWITLEIMRVCLRLVCRQLRYQAPVFEGRPTRNRFPMRFGECFLISGVEWVAVPGDADRTHTGPSGPLPG